MSITPTLPRVLSRRSTSTSTQLQLDRRQPLTPIDPQALFRSSEKILATQSCRVRTGLSPFVKAEVLLVTSLTAFGDQAAIFIITPPSTTIQSSILHIIPISLGFKYRLEQAPPSPSTSFFHQSAKPHITLYLSHEHVKIELRISAAQTAKVQKLVAELRKLTEAALLNATPKTLTHSWTRLYPVQPLTEVDEVDDLGSPETSTATPTAISPSPSTATLSVETPLTALSIGTTQSQVDEEEQYPDPYLPTFSRTAFLRKRLFAKQDKWSSPTNVKIRIATYNVNDKVPPAGTRELAPLVGTGDEDLLVFGFQEVDLRGQALLISQGNIRAEGWEAALFAGLGDRAADFEKLVIVQYVGVMMIVLVRKTLREAVSRVETSERGIGLLGFGGNKAGVAVRLRIHDTTFCFVNAHMAAFATALDRRRSDYLVLKTGLAFPQPAEGTTTLAFEEFAHKNTDRLLSQEDSNLLFWMGDLNFRVELPDAEVRQLAEERKWSEMLEKDQLRSDIASEKSFAGFSEHPIDFPPSFKYVHGSTTFDARRAPAYTDRILWFIPSNAISPAQPITCHEYTSHDILWSDHRPISAAFETHVRVVDEPTRAAELGVVMKELDRLEEVYRPSLEIDELNLEFGQVRYGLPVMREIKLRNMGRVPAVYTFKPPSTDRPFCKPFLWPFPANAVVEPGREVILKVVMDVDEAWAAKLTLGEDINDVLVLQIAGGKDTFITIQATFLPSIIALPLHVLSALPSHIRDVPLADRKILARPLAPSSTNGDAPPKPVRDIWKLLEYLMTNGQGIDRLWLDYGEVLDVIEQLDQGAFVTADSVEDTIIAKNVATALLHILASLPTPLIPIHFQAQCLKAQDRDEAFATLEYVPQINTNVLIGLMSVIRLCATPKGAEGEVPHRLTDREDSSVKQNDDQVAVRAEAEQAVEAATTNEGAFEIGDDDGEEEEEGNNESTGEVQPPILATALAPVESHSTPTIIAEPSTPKSAPVALELASPVPEASEELVDILSPAIFGPGPIDKITKDGRRRFVRLLLEG